MKNKALLVGINKYPDPRNELRGCINDILDMENFISTANVATNKIYTAENIKKLANRDATKKEIIKQIKWLMEGAEVGDQLLFQYSGHGAQLPTLNVNMEEDGLDEIICPYDYNGSATTTIRDKEFAQLFASLPKGVHFVWVSDSCHAEDLSRDVKLDEPVVYRQFHGVLPISYNKFIETESVSSSSITSPLNGALLSACASHELSADAYINNRYNGAFTHYLIKNLMLYNEAKTMQDIIKLVNKDLDQNGYDQNPKIEGLLENKTFFI